MRDVPVLEPYPAQAEIVLGGACDLSCSYCFVDHRGPEAADPTAIERAVERVLELPRRELTFTFTLLEPFTRAGLWMRLVERILSGADKRGKSVQIVATTNGLRLDRRLRRFLEGARSRVRLNVSLDGAPASHDLHRRGALHAGSFRQAWENVRQLPPGELRAVYTATPDRLDRLAADLGFIAGLGLRRIDVFPDAFAPWTAARLRQLGSVLSPLLGAASAASEAMEWRLLNRLWGPTHHGKVLIDADGSFYLYEWARLLPPGRRARYRLGDARRVDWSRRLKLHETLLGALASRGWFKRERGLRRLAWPTPLLLRHGRSGPALEDALRRYGRLAELMVGLASGAPPQVLSASDRARLQAGFARPQPAP
ncbi:MAG: radical SAM protein [Elusimicrobia bacterium]|nr:radical SAM protein [Elusimicrobiota bacterium]MDE2236789.1 radical SAM protein [Elusimicrobiota bacterium]MDE2424994.1 radical SAM protein [Elusimicrobiota bacterium]